MSLIRQYTTPTHDDTHRSDTWVDLPSFSLQGIHQGHDTTVALEALGERVDAADDTVALEHLAWSFQTLSGLVDLEPQTFPALEDHDDVTKQKDVLAQSIKAHARYLSYGVNAAMEDYTEHFGSSLKDTLDEIDKRGKELKKVRLETPDVAIRISHLKIWDMVHRNGALVKNLARELAEEKGRLKALVDHADKIARAIDQEVGKDDDFNAEVIAKVVNTGKDMNLLFNTEVKCRKGRVEFIRIPTPKPKREVTGGDRARSGTHGAIYGAVLGFFLLTPLLGAAAMGGLGALTAHGSGEFGVKNRDTGEIKAFVQNVVTLEALTKDIQRVAKQLGEIVDKADSDRTAVRRQAAIGMELLGHVARHIAELTYGAETLVNKVSQ